MKKKIIFTALFFVTLFLFVLCLTKYVFSFYYTFKKGDNSYHTSVSENITIFNYGKKVKKVSYCFTKEKTCNDYLDYDTNLSKRLINISIDYPDSIEKQRICVKITTDNDKIISCNRKGYVVDSTEPVISSLYDEIIVYDEKTDPTTFFKAEAVSGIKNFTCNYEKSSIKCKATSKNGLSSTYEKGISLSEKNILEGKSVLFTGDSIVEASKILDQYGGWASRVGFANDMDWYNSAVGGATIAKTKKSHILNQITERKEKIYDYIILQGGFNDANIGVPLGEISDSFDVKDFDNKTFAGGLEELFYYTKKYNRNSKIGFLITYQVPNIKTPIDRKKQTEMIRQICDKWEIPYLDMFDGVIYEDGKVKTYTELLKVETGEYLFNGDPTNVHIVSKGYDVSSKYISVWMKTL